MMSLVDELNDWNFISDCVNEIIAEKFLKLYVSN